MAWKNYSENRLLKTLKEQIALFKERGLLPKEYDVVQARDARPVDDEEAEVMLGTSGELSDEFEALRDNSAAFLESLSDMERRVYNLLLVGTMSSTEVSTILGVTKQRIDQIKAAITTKAKRAVAKERRRSGGY